MQPNMKELIDKTINKIEVADSKNIPLFCKKLKILLELKETFDELNSIREVIKGPRVKYK